MIATFVYYQECIIERERERGECRTPYMRCMPSQATVLNKCIHDVIHQRSQMVCCLSNWRIPHTLFSVFIRVFQSSYTLIHNVHVHVRVHQ